ncbi:MAG: DUF3098 domain-containing protein [Bacteroidales bacterium]|nr:DUF3098 domain-containing protein [Bacteroidales bacterium]
MAQTISTTKKEPLKPNLGNTKQKKQDNRPPLFRKTNYILMVIGVILLVLGYILLSAPASPDPAQFDASIFDNRRLVVAPILIAGGLIVEIFAIMWHPHKKDKETAE